MNLAFTVIKRALKDKFVSWKTNISLKKKEQDVASGIDVKETKIDVLLEKIIEKEK